MGLIAVYVVVEDHVAASKSMYELHDSSSFLPYECDLFLFSGLGSNADMGEAVAIVAFWVVMMCEDAASMTFGFYGFSEITCP